jgi:hypothetical protein
MQANEVKKALSKGGRKQFEHLLQTIHELGDAANYLAVAHIL